MLITIGAIGILSLVLGMLHLVFPKAIKSLNNFSGKTVANVRSLAETNRIILGAIYTLAGFFMIYIGFLR